jgi:hypothetical protein
MESKIKPWLMTGVGVLVTLIVYNLFLKSFMPTTIRTWINLG